VTFFYLTVSRRGHKNSCLYNDTGNLTVKEQLENTIQLAMRTDSRVGIV